MKKIVLLSLLCFVFGNSYSQSHDIWKRKPWEELKLRDMHPFTFSSPEIKPLGQQENNQQQMPVLKTEINLKKLSLLNSKFDVFTVEPYHMHCIVPSKEFKMNMPVVGFIPKA